VPPGADDVQVRVFGAANAATGVQAAYQAFSIPPVSASDQPDGLHLQGLRAVGELPLPARVRLPDPLSDIRHPG